jgi:hypothetical protein
MSPIAEQNGPTAMPPNTPSHSWAAAERRAEDHETMTTMDESLTATVTMLFASSSPSASSPSVRV